jgi:molecular chaperone DnaJ
VCLKCEGKRVVIHPYTFSVNIPSGIESGCRILYQGCGNVGLDGGVAGDIYVTINIDQHPIFSREGANLHCSIPVSFTQVALGTSLKIPTLERDDVSIKIKAGTQAGTTFRLKDRGMPVRKSLSRGDLFVKVNVVIPETLTTRQKELLEELAYTLGTEPPKKRRRRKVKA